LLRFRIISQVAGLPHQSYSTRGPPPTFVMNKLVQRQWPAWICLRVISSLNHNHVVSILTGTLHAFNQTLQANVSSTHPPVRVFMFHLVFKTVKRRASLENVRIRHRVSAGGPLHEGCTFIVHCKVSGILSFILTYSVALVSKRTIPSVRRLSAKLVPTPADRGCHLVSVTVSYGRILGFRNRTHCVNSIDNTHYAPNTTAPSTHTKYSHKILH
jgi:hypothetical protein